MFLSEITSNIDMLFQEVRKQKCSCLQNIKNADITDKKIFKGVKVAPLIDVFAHNQLQKISEASPRNY